MSRIPTSYKQFASYGASSSSRFMPDAPVNVSRRIAPLRAAGNVSYVGIVTLDHTMDKDMLSGRQNAISSGRANTIGITATPETTSVNPLEILWKIAGFPQTDGKYDGLQVFSSWNGFEVPNSIFTQSNLEFAVKLAGVAKIGYSYLPDNQNYDMVSSVMRGPTTVTNRGMTTFAMGDVVKACIYNIDPTKRQAELAAHATGRQNKQKLTTFLERVSYRTVNEYASIGAVEFLKRYPDGAPRRAAFAADRYPGSASTDATATPSEALISALSCSVKSMTLAVIDVLECQGLITVNTPESEDRMSQKVAALRELDKRSDADIVTKVYDAMDPATGISPEVALANQERERENRWAKKRTLAGLIGAAQVPGVQAQGGIIQALVLRCLQGFLTEPEVASEYRNYGFENSIPKNTLANKVENEIITRNINAVREQKRAFYHALIASHQHIIGVALNAATPGEEMDILL
jgi:hypothetical protein